MSNQRKNIAAYPSKTKRIRNVSNQLMACQGQSCINHRLNTSIVMRMNIHGWDEKPCSYRVQSFIWG